MTPPRPPVMRMQPARARPTADLISGVGLRLVTLAGAEDGDEEGRLVAAITQPVRRFSSHACRDRSMVSKPESGVAGHERDYTPLKL